MSALFYFSPFTIRVFVLLIVEKAFGAILYGAGSRQLSFVFMERGWKCVLFRFLTI